MNIMKLTLLLIVTFALSFSSCNVGRQESQLFSRMDSIKQRGDTCPVEALTELKKMENEAESSSGYIWNKTSQNSVEDQKRKLAAMEDKTNNIERELKDKIKEAEDVISQQESRFNALNEIIAENEKKIWQKSRSR